MAGGPATLHVCPVGRVGRPLREGASKASPYRRRAHRHTTVATLIPCGSRLPREVAVHNCTTDPLPCSATRPRRGSPSNRTVPDWGLIIHNAMKRTRQHAGVGFHAVGQPAEFVVFNRPAGVRAVEADQTPEPPRPTVLNPHPAITKLPNSSRSNNPPISSPNTSRMVPPDSRRASLPSSPVPPPPVFQPARSRSAGDGTAFLSDTVAATPPTVNPAATPAPQADTPAPAAWPPNRVEAAACPSGGGNSAWDFPQSVSGARSTGAPGPQPEPISWWLRAGIQAVRGLLPGSEMDHRLSRGGRNPGRARPPMTVDEYIRTRTPDAARFEAIPKKRGIRTPSPRGRVRQENRPTAWNTRWLHTPHRAPALPGSDLLFVRCAGEEQYQARLLSLFGRYCTVADPQPGVRLVAFPRPFDRWYSIADRVRWGDNSAKESRLRWRRVDNFFHMWHTTEFFAVPLSARGRLYPALPNGWDAIEAPQYLCVPTPSVMAYVAARWMPHGLAWTFPTPQSRRLVDAILLSEWAVLTLLYFLNTARGGLPFFTKSPDPRLALRSREKHSNRGLLFRLAPRLIQLIRSVGVDAILEGTSFEADTAEALLDFSENLDWSLPERSSGFVWYNWNRGCSLRMPYWDGVSEQPAPWYDTLPGDEEEDAQNSEAVIASGGGWGPGVPSDGTLTGPQADPTLMAEDPAAEAMADPTEVARVPEGVVTPLEDIPVPRRTIRSDQENSPREGPVIPAAEPARAATPAPSVVPSAPVAPAPTVPLSSPALQTSAVTGAEEVPSRLGGNPPPAATAGIPIDSVAAAQAALRDLQFSCEYAGVLAPPTLAAGLWAARAWLSETVQLKARVVDLIAREQRRDSEADRIRNEAMARIRAAQDHLTALGQEVSSLKRPRAADTTDGDGPEAGPSNKRPRRD